MALTYNSFSNVSTGDVLTAALGNQWQENLNNHRVPPMVKCVTTGQTVNDATNTTLSWTSADAFDTDTMHDHTDSSGSPKVDARITINTAGVYLVTACVGYTAGVSDDFLLAIYSSLAGNDRAFFSGGAANTNAYATVTTTVSAAVNDYFYVVAYQNNSANTPRTTTTASHFTATWLGQVS